MCAADELMTERRLKLQRGSRFSEVAGSLGWEGKPWLLAGVDIFFVVLEDDGDLMCYIVFRSIFVLLQESLFCEGNGHDLRDTEKQQKVFALYNTGPCDMLEISLFEELDETSSDTSTVSCVVNLSSVLLICTRR